MHTQLELYLLQTIHDIVELAHGIDNREEMLKAIDNLENTAENLMDGE